MRSLRDLTKDIKNTQISDALRRCDWCARWMTLNELYKIASPDKNRGYRMYQVCDKCLAMFYEGEVAYCNWCSVAVMSRQQYAEVIRYKANYGREKVEHYHRLSDAVGDGTSKLKFRQHLTLKARVARASLRGGIFIDHLGVCANCEHDVYTNNKAHGYMLDCLQWKQFSIEEQYRQPVEREVWDFSGNCGNVYDINDIAKSRVLARKYTTKGINLYIAIHDNGNPAAPARLWFARTGYPSLNELYKSFAAVRTARLMSPRSQRDFVDRFGDQTRVRLFGKGLSP